MVKRISAVLAVIFIIIILCSLPVGAKSYQTYTYALKGYPLNSPDAYVPEIEITSDYIGLTGGSDILKALKEPSDIEVDENGWVYIADSAADTKDAKYSRIVVLDNNFKLKHIIKDFDNDQGNPDTLCGPKGVFITDDTIYVCDTDKNRIVTFDRQFNFIDIIKAPEDELFENDSVYKPVAIAVDQYDRLYVVSSTTNQGVIMMTRDGDFTGFIGAQKSSLSTWDIIWRRFQTDEQRAQSAKVVPTEFNNIAINSDGFVYVTTNKINEKTQQNAIKKKSKSGDYAPVKLLNPAGEEIMRRNGFWPPSGDVQVGLGNDENGGASSIIDAAVGPEKTWSIADSKRSRIFTYDFDGNLLFAFGQKNGGQLGNIDLLAGIVYQRNYDADGNQNYKMLLLDKNNKSFTVFRQTEYGKTLIQALAHQNARQYDTAVDDWFEILKRNSNYDAAYIGIGQSMYRNGQYEESIEYFKAAYDTSNYSSSYEEIRKAWITKWLLLIPIGAAAIIVGCVFFMKYATKVNSRAAVAGGKRNFKEELLYGFHVIFHPFDGFWDLKHEKRGSLRAAIVFILLTIVAYFYKAVGSGYSVNQQTVYTTIVEQAVQVVLPLMLWAIANWCLTTLFDGEGSFKDIVIAVGYSLLPVILTLIPTTFASNFMVSSEIDVLNFITNVGLIWAGLLIFTGMMVTHDYSIGKNLVTTIGTLIGIIFIMFISVLFVTLLGKVVSFVTNIITEIRYNA